MHILLVCKTLPHSFKGGIQTHTWQLSEHLLKAGHRVSILTSGAFAKGTKTRLLEGRTLIELAYLPLRKSPFASAFLDELMFNRAAEQWMLTHQNQFDLIHLQGRSGTLVLRKKERHNVPVVATLHGFKESEYAMEHHKANIPWSVRVHSRFAQKLEQLTLTHAHQLIAVSPFLAEDAQKKCNGTMAPLQIISNGISLGTLPQKVGFSRKKLLFVGRLDRLKGLYELLDAIAAAQTVFELCIVGDGTERNGLEEKAKRLGIAHKVRFLGSMGQTEVQTEIDNCFALILPSFLETQGIVLMEANARCKPVLASDIAGIRSVVEHGQNGLLFEAGHIFDMSQTIDYLFDRPLLAEALGQRGRQKMEANFAWQKIAGKTVALYQNVLERSRGDNTNRSKNFKKTLSNRLDNK